jgi:hypothetical protein
MSIADDEIEELLSLQDAILLLESTNVLAMNSLHHTTRPQLGGFRMMEAILESMDREECLYRFRYASLKFTNAFIPITIARFYPKEIVHLVRVMEIPNPFQTESCYNFTAVEALCILLA